MPPGCNLDLCWVVFSFGLLFVIFLLVGFLLVGFALGNVCSRAAHFKNVQSFWQDTPFKKLYQHCVKSGLQAPLDIYQHGLLLVKFVGSLQGKLDPKKLWAISGDLCESLLQLWGECRDFLEGVPRARATRRLL